MISTAELNPQWAETGQYFCVFLTRHPTDKDKNDEFAQWWPDWYRYKTCKQSQEIIYGDCVLFQPSVIPNSTKYIQWAEEIDLTQTAVRLLGPFNFESISSTNRTRNKVHRDYWSTLSDICNEITLQDPQTSMHHANGKFQRNKTQVRARSQPVGL